MKLEQTIFWEVNIISGERRLTRKETKDIWEGSGGSFILTYRSNCCRTAFVRNHNTYNTYKSNLL